MISTEECNRARAELREPSDGDAFRWAFQTLLDADDLDAVCAALDLYQEWHAFTRHGADNPYEPYADTVREVARGLLRAEDTGATHQSALNAMLSLAEAEDADLIAAALGNDDLRQDACFAASSVLMDTEGPSPRLEAALFAVVLDSTLDIGEREFALVALCDSDTADDLLVRASESDELRLQVVAAFALATPRRIRVHRERVARLAASWPEDAGFYAREVRERLAGFHSVYWTSARLDDPRLRRAHEELMFPADDEGCLQAFLTLLRSGDTVAVGIALDHYRASEGLRWTLLDESAAERHLPEVLGRARAVLRRPPSPAALNPEYGVGADHLSALDTIGVRHAGPGDAGLVAHLIRSAATDSIRGEAVWMAYGVLGAAKAPEVVAALRDLLFDPDPRWTGVRDRAVRVLAEKLGPEADEILLRLVRGDNRAAQGCAVYHLVGAGGLDRHRDLLVEIAEGWGNRAPASPGDGDLAEMVLGGPHSTHWNGHRLADPDLHLAHRELRRPASDAALARAFRTLLGSDDPAAVGIAMDHWAHAGGHLRRLDAQGRALVLDRVREVLPQPPTAASLGPDGGPGANHLSALDALRVSGAAEVAGLVHILRTAVGGRVRQAAVDTVSSLLEEAGELDPTLVEALADLACDGGAPIEIRVGAVCVLGEVPDGEGALVRVAACPEADVQVTAAYALSRSEAHREVVERLVASWPAEWDSWEVRSIRERLG
ncbi:hypothetical protein [Nonomuraea longicatena]|uniref:HEAT repeat protein n=1 Tax=Nonomuraea longicatena TaxID=83682 RepID=A0ABN1NM00_9ACTN